MNPSEAQLAIALRRLAQSSRAAEFSAEAACAPGKQLAAVKSPARRKCKKCGRRAGKSTSDAIELLLDGLRDPIIPELYVTLTRGNAKEILLPILTRLNEEYQLGYRRVGDADFVSPIGVAIQLRGANDVKDIEKIRGHVFKRAHVDEPGSMPDRIIRPLVVDIIQPTLMDYQGPLVLSGTPPPLRHGYFYDCYSGKLKDNWEQHHWTVRDNERFPARMRGLDIEKILAEIRRENRWEPDDPTYLREYEGLDVEDRKSLLIDYQAIRNDYDDLPSGDWRYVLAWDLGTGSDNQEQAKEGDPMALGVLGWPRGSRIVYLVEEWGETGGDITSAAEAAQGMVDRYHPQSMVIDEGGLGKLIANEIRRRHRLPVKAAEKTQKGAFIKLFNTALRRGEFLCRADSIFAEETGLVRKDFAALAQGKLRELSPNKGGFHGNMTDVALYGWRECQAFMEIEAPAHPPGYVEPSEYMLKALAEQKRMKGRDPLGIALGFDD
jgi:Terminase-like family.